MVNSGHKKDRDWNETEKQTLRNKIVVGDLVLANGMIGTIKKIRPPTGPVPRLFLIEICKGSEVWMIDTTIDDILPSDDTKRTEELYKMRSELKNKAKKSAQR